MTLPVKRPGSAKPPSLVGRKPSFHERLEDWREKAEIAAFMLWVLTHPRQWREMEAERERRHRIKRLMRLRSVPEIGHDESDLPPVLRAKPVPRLPPPAS